MQMGKECLLSCAWLLLCCIAKGQPALADAQLKTLRGSQVSYSSLTQKDSLILVCFWSTSSEESINELNAISANLEKWKAMTPFRMLAISLDEGKAVNKIKPMANVNDWTFDILVDFNSDLRNALHSNNLPQSMIIRRGRIVYEQSGYQPGSEAYLMQRMLAIVQGKS